jgi:hypothetical protein
VTAARSLSKAAQRLLARIAGVAGQKPRHRPLRREARAGAELIAGAYATRNQDGRLVPTAAGLARAHRAALADAGVDPFLGQHLALSTRRLAAAAAVVVVVDDGESPLAWLARRAGRDGRPMISAVQLLAGERLRADFTRAQMMPRTTSNWAAPITGGAAGAPHAAEAMVAARQRVRAALAAVGPEFSGLLVDVCCFLKGLADVERERVWPPRSAKVVLQLGLDRLARHYGIAAQARGPARAPITTWLAEDAAFRVE